MPQQGAAGSVPLKACQHVRMANEIAVPYALNAHDADQHPVHLQTDERDPMRDIATELVNAHVRLVPEVPGNHSSIGDRGFIDDLQDATTVIRVARPNVAAGWERRETILRFLRMRIQ